MVNSDNEARNLETAQRYLAALERRDSPQAIGEFLHPDIAAEELPNRLFPSGARRDLAGMLQGVERGNQILSSQSYQIATALAEGERVALEVAWTGTLARAFGEQLPQGTTLRARIGMFLEFRAFRIVSQRNYDCYEAW